MPALRVFTNGEWATLSWEDVHGPQPLIEIKVPEESRSLSSFSEGFGLDALTGNTPLAQTNRGPNRPPTAAIRDAIGTFGIGWQTYPGGFTAAAIRNGYPFPPFFVKVDGNFTTETFPQLLDATPVAQGFITTMTKGGYDPALILSAHRFQPYQLATNIFNAVNVGMLMLHSSYATTTESSSSIKHIYLRFYNYYGDKSQANVKLSDCSFGGAETNGLKWMALCCCSAMKDENWNTMKSYSKLPINNDLHLLLGASTVMTAAPDLASLWASNMLHGVTVEQSWYNAGLGAYGNGKETNHTQIIFSVAGWPNCFTDLIKDTDKSPDSGDQSDIEKHNTEVYFLP